MTADLEQRARAIAAVARVQAMPHRPAGQSDRLAHPAPEVSRPMKALLLTGILGLVIRVVGTP